MNNYLILACVVWISCAFSTIFTKNTEPLGIALNTTFLIWLVWVLRD